MEHKGICAPMWGGGFARLLALLSTATIGTLKGDVHHASNFAGTRGCAPRSSAILCVVLPRFRAFWRVTRRRAPFVGHPSLQCTGASKRANPTGILMFKSGKRSLCGTSGCCGTEIMKSDQGRHEWGDPVYKKKVEKMGEKSVLFFKL